MTLVADPVILDRIHVGHVSIATHARASAAGARVLPNPEGPGKGQALRHAVAQGDLLVFLDADGERIHRNRPLDQLRPHACDVLDAVLARTPLTNVPGELR